MADTKKTKKTATPVDDRIGDNIDIEWGETNQERIVEQRQRSGSDRHRCKGPQCATAFEKF